MLRFLAILCVFLFLASPSQASPQAGPCEQSNDGDYAPDDESCAYGWRCSASDSKWVLAVECQGGQVFDPSAGDCVDEDEYDCVLGDPCADIVCENDNVCSEGDCYCKAPWYGEFCTELITEGTSAAADCTTIACENGGACIATDSGFSECYCPLGFTGAYCEEGLASEGQCLAAESVCDPPCENGGRCFEEDGAPTCFCPAGFAGQFCTDEIDACLGVDCENDGVCVIEDGYGVCQCTEEYQGERCEDEVPEECIGYECLNGGRCVVDGSGQKCACPQEYTGDKCQYLNACTMVVCLNEGTCSTNDQGVATCDCTAQYTGNFCEVVVDCDDYTCYNEGTCTTYNNERICECGELTEGELCEKKLNCTADGVTPCQNGGSCVNSADGFVCVCPIGWKGEYCTEQRTCSDGVFCYNDGICEDTDEGTAECVCTAEFSGPRCETPVDDCGGCLNGGICNLLPILPADSPPEYKLCACLPGYTGEHCEIPTDCTLPCPEQTGASGLRYHIFLYPDVEDKEWVYVCHLGRISHMKYCDGTWFDAFSVSCHSEDSFASAVYTAGNALYPGKFD